MIKATKIAIYSDQRLSKRVSDSEIPLILRQMGKFVTRCDNIVRGKLSNVPLLL